MSATFRVIIWAAWLPLSGQNGHWQKPGEIQKPKGAWQAPGQIQRPGEIQKVREQCKARFLVGADALFEFDKAELTPAAGKVLAELELLIRREGKHPLLVEGHTDAIGPAEYNRQLSEKRARAVQSWLESNGSSGSVRGYGKTRPVAPNTNPDGTDNPDGRQKNRRVEIVIDTCKS